MPTANLIKTEQTAHDTIWYYFKLSQDKFIYAGNRSIKVSWFAAKLTISICGECKTEIFHGLANRQKVDTDKKTWGEFFKSINVYKINDDRRMQAPVDEKKKNTYSEALRLARVRK